MAEASRIRVMICDESSVVRSIITRALSMSPQLEIVASVGNGLLAGETLRKTGVDIVLLGFEMPGMDGLTALPLLLKIDPSVKVIMVSGFAAADTTLVREAAAIGASDCIFKARRQSPNQFETDVLSTVLKLGSRRSQPTSVEAKPRPNDGAQLRPAPRQRPLLIAIGSSTGGPDALSSLFSSLSQRLPQPIVITQHMPPGFTRSLAANLARSGHRPCVEAEDLMPLLPNRIHVAPGGRHMIIESEDDGLRARLVDTPHEHSCRPAVDPMLRSAAVACRGRVLTVILTGMGRDGTAGARCVVEAGGTVLAQDEASSAVWGMPGSVARDGLCHDVLALERLPAKLLELASVA